MSTENWHVVRLVENLPGGSGPDYSLIHLRDGRVLEVGDEGINVYANFAHFVSGEFAGQRLIFESNARSGTGMPMHEAETRCQAVTGNREGQVPTITTDEHAEKALPGNSSGQGERRCIVCEDCAKSTLALWLDFATAGKKRQTAERRAQQRREGGAVNTETVIPPSADASCSRWTQKLPDRDGWWWHRHVVGAIPTDQPLRVLLMSGETVHSVYWRGQWRTITELPRGIRWQWSDRPIAEPSGHLFGGENKVSTTDLL